MLDSAVQSGVQAALSIVMSLYPDVDLDLLHALRAGLEASVGVIWSLICKIVEELVVAIDPLEHTHYLDDDVSPVPQASLSDLLYTTTEEGTQSRPARRR